MMIRKLTPTTFNISETTRLTPMLDSNSIKLHGVQERIKDIEIFIELVRSSFHELGGDEQTYLNCVEAARPTPILGLIFTMK